MLPTADERAPQTVPLIRAYMQSRTTSAYKSIMTRFCNLLKENCPDLEEIMYVADDEDAQGNAAVTCLGFTFAVTHLLVSFQRLLCALVLKKWKKSILLQKK